MSKISELIKDKAIGFVFNLVSLIVIVTVLLLVIYVFAAFVEPSSAPSASNQDFAQNILGADNADNSFASTNVAANVDGSIIERLEYIWTQFNSKLDATVSSRLAATSYVTERGTDNAALASNYTATRAGYLDAAISSRATWPKFYVTAGTYQGDVADTSCASGYHMCYAGEWIGHKVDATNNCDGCWEYNAWFDTNTNATDNSNGDCSNWSSNSGSYYGNAQVVTYIAGSMGGWAASRDACNTSRAVLCCEN